MLKGLDVSHYQPQVDWNFAKVLGYKFAFAKASDGAKGIDNMFQIHKAGIRAAGLKFGAYHFFRFGEDPIAQVENFLKAAGAITAADFPLCLDIEWDRHSPANYDKDADGDYVDDNHGPKYGEGTRMDAAALALVQTAKDALQKAIGRAPMIYTNFYFWPESGADESFAACPLWVPAYNTTPDKVKVPAPWKKFDLWQNSERLTIKGVQNIDENTFLGDEEELGAFGQ